jgi:Leucine-rich repeat (LRR) protein
MNMIPSIPNALMTAKYPKENLQELILNMNPLTELSGLIRYLKNLRVLGIGHSKITELPSQLQYLTNLQQIVVENTPL